MDLKKINDRLYNSDFINYLELLTKDKWNKLKKNKKLELIGMFQEIFHSFDNELPQKVKTLDFSKEGIYNQDFFVENNEMFVNETLLGKDVNPYDVLRILYAENELFRLINGQYTNINVDGKDRRCYVNLYSDYFGEWSNFYPRNDIDFMNQPVAYFARKEANNFIYSLLKHTNGLYGGDKYINNMFMELFSENLKEESWVEKIENNYFKMKDRIFKSENKTKEIINKIENQLPNYLSRLNQLADKEFFALLNNKVLYCCSVEDRISINKEFVRRVLKGYKDLDSLVDSIGCDMSTNENNFTFDGETYNCDYIDEIFNLLLLCYPIKVREGLLFEIKDEKLKKEISESCKYFDGYSPKDYEHKYLDTAYSYADGKKYIYSYYLKLIEECVKHSNFINDCEGCLTVEPLGNCEEYLLFTYDKTYEEVKKEQLELLKEQYKAKKAGGR